MLVAYLGEISAGKLIRQSYEVDIPGIHVHVCSGLTYGQRPSYSFIHVHVHVDSSLIPRSHREMEGKGSGDFGPFSRLGRLCAHARANMGALE